jgi:integrative and conjugative element protein (TIGR02256 family)
MGSTGSSVWRGWKKTPSLELRSIDGRFQVRVPGRTVARILRSCRRSGRRETGGILVGRYSAELDCALVSTASGAPPDSRRGSTWFERGTRGLQAWLDRRWTLCGAHYLGEWHFHPFAAPVPSPTDRDQLRTIARTASYGCPEPVLLIVGGDPAGAWEVSGHVFPRDKKEVVLHRL